MTKVTNVCPQCNTNNKPDSLMCRTCGYDIVQLPEGNDPHGRMTGDEQEDVRLKLGTDVICYIGGTDIDETIEADDIDQLLYLLEDYALEDSHELIVCGSKTTWKELVDFNYEQFIRDTYPV